MIQFPGYFHQVYQSFNVGFNYVRIPVPGAATVMSAAENVVSDSCNV